MGKFTPLEKALEQAAKALRDVITRPKPFPPPPIPVPVPVPDTIPDTPPTTIPTDKPTTKDDTATKTETETKRRERNCCDPTRFQSAWPKGIRPAVNEAGNPNAHKYQVLICGPLEYLCTSTTGKSVWADGLFPGKCWMHDAKWSKNSKTSIFRLEKPFVIWRSIDNEFERYGIVANQPSPPAAPCWMIGLQVTTTHKENVPFFEHLLTKHNLPLGSRSGVNIVRDFDEAIKEIDEQVQEEIEKLKKYKKENP